MALLDEIDGNPDLEDNGDYEPWLSGFNRFSPTDDREGDISDWEPNVGGEPDEPEWAISFDMVD